MRLLLSMRVLVFIGLLTLCACSTTSSVSKLGQQSVRSIDFSKAPEMQAFADRVRQSGDAIYPKVCALLAEDGSEFPSQFDIVFEPRLRSGRSGEARNTQIALSAHYLNTSRENPIALVQLLTHEMAHVAQHYYRPLIGHWLYYTPEPPSWLEEGIADYVCFKLGQTNTWICAECDTTYPDYQSGYACAGAFLLYLEAKYDANLVRKLNAVLRRGKFSDACFAQATGKSLPELWTEFQRTPAFTSNATRMIELRQALGYIGDRAPTDVETRFNAHLVQHTDATTREMINSAHISGLTTNDLKTRMVVFLYFTQPGGTAESFLIGLKKEYKLPGYVKGEHGTLTGLVNQKDLKCTFPSMREFTATKQGDTATYHYTLLRETVEAPWKLQRAWRTTSEGPVAEEYHVPCDCE